MFFGGGLRDGILNRGVGGELGGFHVMEFLMQFSLSSGSLSLYTFSCSKYYYFEVVIEFLMEFSLSPEGEVLIFSKSPNKIRFYEGL